MKWSINRVCALVLGIIYALIAIVGFFTPTENSTGVQAVFGLFDTDRVHNILYLVIGLIGIGMAFAAQSRTYNKVFGIFFLVVGILGLLPMLYFPMGAYGTDSGLFLGLTHDNAGDHVLHIVTGLAATYIGFFLAGPASHPRRLDARARERVTE